MTRSALDPSSPPPEAAKVRRKPLKAFDRAIADEIVAAVTRGRPMRRFLASDRRLPCLAVAARWRAENPAFAAELKMAMVVSRYVRGARRLWSPALEAEISWRIIGGRSLRQVAAMPDMPCQSTLVNWSRRKAGFREGMEWSADERGATRAEPFYRAIMAQAPPLVWGPPPPDCVIPVERRGATIRPSSPGRPKADPGEPS